MSEPQWTYYRPPGKCGFKDLLFFERIAPTSLFAVSSSPFCVELFFPSFASHSFRTGVMNVSSDALNTKENNDEHIGNDDGNSETQEGERRQEACKGEEGSGHEENGESDQGEAGSKIWKQGRDCPGADEEGWRD